ncbi:MazG nucleotide pyrophosphohydrolase domain-containing protein [Salinicoccus bachuensis]|uniref:MazG nucleotide pyrophosphohydrolase domain-containing protein n=1 Tax=Salinicoccus bachuensis TaxID=3136731 RepID=A0ABZ3CI20_9STAP
MKHIEIIGLGSSDLDQMPLGIWRRLENAGRIHLRTKDHPAVSALAELGVELVDFDHLYEQNETFEATYHAIVAALMEEAEQGEVLYAVPGHPLFYETTTELLIERERNGEVTLAISGGQSFIDAVITALKVPVNEGFQVLDGTSFKAGELDYHQHTLITQVYDQYSLGEAKLSLLDYYPAETRVEVVDAAGSAEEQVYSMALHEIDHLDIQSNLLCLYIPRVEDSSMAQRDIHHMTEIFDILVGEEGCPWDKVQTHESIERHLIEETYEVIEAIERQDDDAIVEELGDILLQVALHSAIGKKNGYFDFYDVLDSLNAKVVRRHPHVFGEASVESLDDLSRVWSEAKAKEGKKEKVKYEKAYGEIVLEWMKETIHHERALEDILKEGGDRDET